jgi:hypothetical protein
VARRGKRVGRVERSGRGGQGVSRVNEDDSGELYQRRVVQFVRTPRTYFLKVYRLFLILYLQYTVSSYNFYQYL